ncbi:peptide ABC transporter ATP-binding protein [Streptomyces spinoverrucosus]|uniref:Peptide ABC transporter ATP-binding protein n=1 Tax=Streptomyces spinoverrucosus TaxID=284043 RepID=A0A4Y3VT57_9ACTN|nr:ABC transporter ATP-binding protein [Streptomyces spinoverrucosus]GEC09813.1 peptide ABC transporter ATP-binding protein [Streptomyces spinoverrucosus]GHB96929.1 peptide ABC transporter ATP-binding protein [Streptomyces spinoverrucosus]
MNVRTDPALRLPGSSSPVVLLDGVSRYYGGSASPVPALAEVTTSITYGELVAITGPSGSGKSTLLNLIGTLDRPSSGRIIVDGHDLAALDDRRLSALRAHRMGFVFQHFHLAEGTTALDNVADGLLYTGLPRRERRARAGDALHTVGLGHRLRHRPHQLSGGERQRVAIARAVVGDPVLLLADEPTGALDSNSGGAIVDLLHRLNDNGTTVVVITHDVQLAARLPRCLSLRDGRLIADSAYPTAAEASR